MKAAHSPPPPSRRPRLLCPPPTEDSTETSAADARVESVNATSFEWVVQALMRRYREVNLEQLCEGASLSCTGSKTLVANRLVANLRP